MLAHPNATTAFIPAQPDLIDDFTFSILTKENPCCDPIHEDKGQWYFWDETWSSREGPFETKEIALESLRTYCDWLDGKLPGQQKS